MNSETTSLVHDAPPMVHSAAHCHTCASAEDVTLVQLTQQIATLQKQLDALRTCLNDLKREFEAFRAEGVSSTSGALAPYIASGEIVTRADTISMIKRAGEVIAQKVYEKIDGEVTQRMDNMTEWVGYKTNSGEEELSDHYSAQGSCTKINQFVGTAFPCT